MATRKTTCQACFDLPSNDQGKPMKDGTPVQLCLLTRPEVKERIQRKLAKGTDVDDDLCTDCHHLVSVHVATNDDAMSWPPQPVGVQSRAQGLWDNLLGAKLMYAVEMDVAAEKEEAFKAKRKGLSLRAAVVAVAIRLGGQRRRESDAIRPSEGENGFSVEYFFSAETDRLTFVQALEAVLGTPFPPKGVTISKSSSLIDIPSQDHLVALSWEESYKPRDAISPEKPTDPNVVVFSLGEWSKTGLPVELSPQPRQIARVTKSDDPSSSQPSSVESLDQNDDISKYQYVDLLREKSKKYQRCHLKAKRNSTLTEVRDENNLIACTPALHNDLDGLDTQTGYPAIDVHGFFRNDGPVVSRSTVTNDEGNAEDRPRFRFWLILMFVQEGVWPNHGHRWRIDTLTFDDEQAVAVPIEVLDPKAMAGYVEAKTKENRLKWHKKNEGYYDSNVANWNAAVSRIKERLRVREEELQTRAPEDVSNDMTAEDPDEDEDADAS